MATSKVVLTTSKIWILEDTLSSSEQEPTDQSLRCCVLKWRQGKLWVKVAEADQISQIPALQNEQWLENCLKHSLVDVVCLDPQLGVTAVEYWANACEKAGKPVFLRLPGCSRRSHQSEIVVLLRQGLDSMIAVLLLLIFSPIILVIFLLLRSSSSKSVFDTQWRVGARGQLFRLILFREDREENSQGSQYYSNLIRYWSSKLCLNGLLQLINVIQGKMQLVGRRPWKLQEAIQLCQHQSQLISEPPGIALAYLCK
ncbi:heterocyst development glycosyltransferase HepC [Thermocoleostomius sinensis]|uniref:Sugar transferase n=1 Tax=Thermocoleostomius sinensis A174 TaxID=2016057 RepID=A0A9E8ZH12_9CYAN|nr:heterocyst development glycosyltransferase HepC [Thermocoleostomius sinensis]WAL58376.1 sugar transferase [Thermocoleostomius sinensis A174]